MPLDSAGKLGVILFQFPPWYFPEMNNESTLLLCRSKLPQYQLAIEFRHGSWVNEKNYERTISFLTDNRLSYVCVDEPQGFKTSVPPIIEATADIGIIRLHGKNAKTWEKENLTASKRFDYLYSEDELTEWKPRIKELAGKTKQLHILFNNCYDDKAVKNARQIAMTLD